MRERERERERENYETRLQQYGLGPQFLGKAHYVVLVSYIYALI